MMMRTKRKFMITPDPPTPTHHRLERDRDRQTGRETDRQIDIQADRQTDR